MGLKGKTNAWIKKSGQFIPVGYMSHNKYADDFFREKYGHDWLEKVEELGDKYNVSYSHEILHTMGWVRLVTWSDGKTVVCGNCTPFAPTLDTVDPSLSHKQKETLQDWCMENDFKYENLFNYK